MIPSTPLLLLSLLAARAEDPAAAPTGWHWAALPIGNYSSTYGVGYGAYGTVVNYGKGDLGADPYKAKLALQLYFTTGSYYDHFLKLDFPGIFGSKFRWDVQAGVTGWPTASWYGWGNDQPRYVPEESCSPETAEEDAVAGTVVPCFYNYGQKLSFKVITNLRREIRGPWSVFVNYYLRNYTLNIYPDSLLDDLENGTADQLGIGLSEPAGLGGGVYTRLGLGAMYDTRDQEPSPTAGVFDELSVRGGVNLSAPDERVVAVNFTDRRWLGFGKRKRLVLASREVVDMKWGREPFFMSQTLGGSEDISIGTSMLMRGIPYYGRFSGDGAVFWTPEVRWNYVTAHIAGNPLDFVTGPFVDIGRVWLWDADAVGAVEDELTHLHMGYGLANRFIWDKNMVVRLDVGFGRDEVIDPTTKEISTVQDFGLYLVFDHPY